MCRPGQGNATLWAGSKEVQELDFVHKRKCFHFTAFPFFFHQAADYFKGEESNSSANKCMLKVLSIRLQKKALHMKLVFHTKQGHSNLEIYVIKISFRLLSMPQPWRTTTRQSKFMNRSPTSVQLTNTTSDIVKVWFWKLENLYCRLQHLHWSQACWSTARRSISSGCSLLSIVYIAHSACVWKLFSRASLCHLCIDALNAQHAVAK